MKRTKDLGDICWPLLLSAVAGTLYLKSLSKCYVFEGLARAMPIDLGRFSGLFSGNYLLYGLTGYLFHGMLHAIGASNPAYISLQIMDALIGAAGLFLYFNALRRIGASVVSAAIWSVVLGASLAYWSWSTDAQNYIFSTFLLAAVFLALIRQLKHPQTSPYLLGLLHAAAVLGHIVNVLFAPAALWLLASAYGKKWRVPAVQYIGALGAGVLASYALALWAFVRPFDPHRAFHWFLGSASNGWHGMYGPEGKWEWIKMTAHIFVSFSPQFLAPPAAGWAAVPLQLSHALLAIFAGISLRSARRWSGERRAVGVACLLWIASYALVFTTWEPNTMVYRVSDLIPLTTLLYLGYEELRSRLPSLTIVAGIFAAALLLGNFGAEIYPKTFEGNNPELGRMAFLKEATPHDAWIAAGGGMDELYIPYFAQRRPLIVERYGPSSKDLASRIESMLAAGQAVYATSRLFENAAWEAFFRPFRPISVAHDGNGFTVYRLQSPSPNPASEISE